MPMSIRNQLVQAWRNRHLRLQSLVSFRNPYERFHSVPFVCIIYKRQFVLGRFVTKSHATSFLSFFTADAKTKTGSRLKISIAQVTKML